MERLLFLLTFLVSSLGHAMELNCQTNSKIEGWNGGYILDHIYLYSDISRYESLYNLTMEGAYQAYAPSSHKMHYYQPGTRTYLGFDRFQPLQSEWYTFYLLLPHNYSEKTNSFRAYLQISFQNGFLKTVSLRCGIRHFGMSI